MSWNHGNNAVMYYVKYILLNCSWRCVSFTELFMAMPEFYWTVHDDAWFLLNCSWRCVSFTELFMALREFYWTLHGVAWVLLNSSWRCLSFTEHFMALPEFYWTVHGVAYCYRACLFKIITNAEEAYIHCIYMKAESIIN